MTIPVSISLYEPPHVRCHTYADKPPVLQLFGDGLNYCLAPDPTLTPQQQHERAMQLLHAVTQYTDELERIRDREYLHQARPHTTQPRPHDAGGIPQWNDGPNH